MVQEKTKEATSRRFHKKSDRGSYYFAYRSPSASEMAQSLDLSAVGPEIRNLLKDILPLRRFSANAQAYKKFLILANVRNKKPIHLYVNRFFAGFVRTGLGTLDSELIVPCSALIVNVSFWHFALEQDYGNNLALVSST